MWSDPYDCGDLLGLVIFSVPWSLWLQCDANVMIRRVCDFHYLDLSSCFLPLGAGGGDAVKVIISFGWYLVVKVKCR